MHPFIEKYGLANRAYIPKVFHGVLYYFFIIGEMPIASLKRQYGEGYPLTLYFGTEGLGKWYWDDKEMQRIGSTFIQKTLKDPAYVETIIQRWVELNRVFQRTYRGLTKESVANFSDRVLANKLMRFYHAYSEQYGIAIGVQDPFSMRADVLWQDRFRKQLGNRFDEIFPHLVAATEYSFVERECIDRLKILQLIQQNEERVKIVLNSANAEEVRDRLPKVWKRLERHARTYFFISNNYAVAEYLEAAYFLKKIQEDLRNGVMAKDELRRRIRAHKHALKNKAELIERYQLSQEERLLLHIADRFTWQQDERKKFMMIANYYLSLFLHEVSRRTGVSEDLLKQSYPAELVDVLLNGVRKEDEWRARRAFCVCVNTSEGYELLSGDAARQIHEELFPSPENSVKEFKGMIASQGIARGIVKILLKRHDVVGTPFGSIVVASMTRPEMVPAMQRAAAIITDEGGVTSHAAIVSRELGKPCIIGTKVATHVLNDGDEVEVDAMRGVVTVLKRA